MAKDPIVFLAKKLGAKPEPFDEVVKAYDLAGAEKVFRPKPALAYVRPSTLRIPKKEFIFGAFCANTTLYVIDGDLVVDGIFDLGVQDGTQILHVTGDVRAKHVAVSADANLWIGRDLAAKSHLLLNSKKGSLRVGGNTIAEHVIDVRAKHKPHLREPFGDPDEFENLIAAVKKGQPVFA